MTLASPTGSYNDGIVVSQRLWMAARSLARSVASNLNAYVDYDLHMYEAFGTIRQWTPGDVIFDVGANDGRTIFRLLRHLPQPKIYAFEPVAQTYQTLTEATAECSGVESYQLGLGNEIGTREMYINERAALNSLYPDWGTSRGIEEVELTKLDRFAEDKGIDRIHLLKIDTEGHDLEVLKGAKTLLEEGRVEIIQVEAGFSAPGCGQPPLEAIQNYLRKSGYFLYGIYNQCRNFIPEEACEGRAGANDPAVLQFCDALFVRVSGRAEAAQPSSALSRLQ